MVSGSWMGEVGGKGGHSGFKDTCNFLVLKLNSGYMSVCSNFILWTIRICFLYAFCTWRFKLKSLKNLISKYTYLFSQWIFGVSRRTKFNSYFTHWHYFPTSAWNSFFILSVSKTGSPALFSRRGHVNFSPLEDDGQGVHIRFSTHSL